MRPTRAEIRILDCMASRIRNLAKCNCIPVEKLRLDYYEFEVYAGKVRNGLCLYYCEEPSDIQDGDEWYSNNLSPISLKIPNWHTALPAYHKLLMGGPDWYKDEHHLRVIGQSKPSGFYGARNARKGHPYAIFWKMPKRIRLYNCSPQPMECYVEGCRLNLLFILNTESENDVRVPLDISYDIPKLSHIVYPPFAEVEVVKEVVNLPWLKSRDKAKEVYEKAHRAGLRTGDLWFKLGLTLYDGEFYDEAIEAFKRAQELCTDLHVFGAMVWQGHILDILGSRDEALRYYQKAKEIYDEGTMRHDQYGLVIDNEWVEERLKSPFKRQNAKI